MTRKQRLKLIKDMHSTRSALGRSYVDGHEDTIPLVSELPQADVSDLVRAYQYQNVVDNSQE